MDSVMAGCALLAFLTAPCTHGNISQLLAVHAANVVSKGVFSTILTLQKVSLLEILLCGLQCI